MKQAVIFHGTPTNVEYNDSNTPSESNAHWIPWLQKQLLLNGLHAHTPEIFESYEADYDKWLTELNR